MPSQITLTAAQLKVLADTKQTVIIKELQTTITPVEAWVLEDDIAPHQHRSLIVDPDGEILSNVVMNDSD